MITVLWLRKLIVYCNTNMKEDSIATQIWRRIVYCNTNMKEDSILQHKYNIKTGWHCNVHDNLHDPSDWYWHRVPLRWWLYRNSYSHTLDARVSYHSKYIYIYIYIKLVVWVCHIILYVDYHFMIHIMKCWFNIPLYNA